MPAEARKDSSGASDWTRSRLVDGLDAVLLHVAQELVRNLFESIIKRKFGELKCGMHSARDEATTTHFQLAPA
jgi:hypothetical protein